MKKLKKIFCLLLITMMAVGVTTAATSHNVSAAKTSTIKKGKTYTVNGMKYKVTKVSGKKGTVTLVGPTSKKVKSVVLKDTVKIKGYKLTLNAISANAFKNCTKLKTVETNPALKTIGNSAFSGCSSVEEIAIASENLTTIGSSAFSGCGKLETLYIGSENLISVGKNALKGVNEDVAICTSAEKSLEYDAMLRGVELSQSAPEIAPQQTEPSAPQATEPKEETTAPKTENQQADLTAPEAEQSAPEAADKNEKTDKNASSEKEDLNAKAPQEQPKDEGNAAPAPAPQTPAEKPAETPKSNTDSTAKKGGCTAGHHVFSRDWKVTREPTCVSAGSKSRTCDCGQVGSSTSYGAPTGKHNFVSKTTAATCSTAGSSYNVCSMCGLKTNVTTIPATGHSYTTVTTAADCTRGGQTYQKCTKCGHQTAKTATPATGHKWRTETVRASCTMGGYTQQVCDVCGKKGAATTISPAAHNLVAGRTVEGNCKTDGYTIMECTECSYTEKVVTKTAYGHTLVSAGIKTQATCQHEGEENLVCAVCGYTTTKTLSKTDHRWVLNDNRIGLKECADCHLQFKDSSLASLVEN